MQYMVLIYDDESKWETLSAPEQERVMTEYRDFTAAIVKSGHFRSGDQLAPSGTAKSLRGRDGQVLATDGPFAETREQLAGYYLLEARDADEAVSLAGRIPSLRIGGSVEVRPVIPMSAPA
jgi:hypothetical protein